METIEVAIKRLPSYGDLPLPSYQTVGAAGFDLRAAIPETLLLAPAARALIPTGLSMAVPAGYELQIRPRSGLAVKYGVTVLNSPGTVDSDYRGEICIPLINLGEKPFAVERGMRIAQGVLAACCRAQFAVAAALTTTARGDGGFGHTGHD